jgi:hypothetical protein
MMEALSSSETSVPIRATNIPEDDILQRSLYLDSKEDRTKWRPRIWG